MIVAGLDEAGYGPMLGPLVVSLAAFRVKRSEDGRDLWRALDSAVTREVKDAAARLVVNDSKEVYSPGRGIARLEEGVLAALLARAPNAGEPAAPQIPPDAGSLLAALGAGAPDVAEHPWYADLPATRLPAAAHAEIICSHAARLAAALEARDAAIVRLASAPLAEGPFNRALARTGNKADVNFEAFLGLVRTLLESFPAEPIAIVADKLGGRDRYGPQVASLLPDASIRILDQGATRSAYALTSPVRPPVTIAFEPEGDKNHLPVSLASMASKYVREIHVASLNRWFAARRPGLRPTAGYPDDARRFLADVEPVLAREGILRQAFVRSR